MTAAAAISRREESPLVGEQPPRQSDSGPPDVDVTGLEELTRREGIDAATLALYEAISRASRHASFVGRIDQLRHNSPSPRPLKATVALVPGALYREFPHAGADGKLLREQAERLGCHTALIPCDSTGSLADNAQVICRWLVERPEDETILLVSVSKGGSDVKLALAQPQADRAFRRVAAWINLCGILDGSPAVNWLMGRRLGSWCLRSLFRLRGWNFRAIADLIHGPGSPLDFPLRVPAHLRIVHVIGFPQADHMTTPLARKCRQEIARLGPNDGLVLLSDTCRLPGLIYPVWGADHYLRPSWDMRSLATALLTYLGEELDLFASPAEPPGGTF